MLGAKSPATPHASAGPHDLRPRFHSDRAYSVLARSFYIYVTGWTSTDLLSDGKPDGLLGFFDWVIRCRHTRSSCSGVSFPSPPTSSSSGSAHEGHARWITLSLNDVFCVRALSTAIAFTVWQQHQWTRNVIWRVLAAGRRSCLLHRRDSVSNRWLRFPAREELVALFIYRDQRRVCYLFALRLTSRCSDRLALGCRSDLLSVLLAGSARLFQSVGHDQHLTNR